MPFDRSSTETSGHRSSVPNLALAAAAGVFGSLDTALNIAFPDLLVGLGIEVADLQWVVVTFVLSSGAALLVAGQLGDLADHRLLVQVGAICSVGALVACATAPSYGWFLAARVAQGLSTALVMAGAPALATGAAAAGGRGRALGVFSAAVGLGAAAGPALGGPLVSLGGWPAVFWFRVPIAGALALLAVVVGRGERRSRQRRAGAVPGHSDVPGAVLIAVGLSAALLVIGSGSRLGFDSPAVLGAIALTAIVVVVQRRRAAVHPAPVLPPGLLGRGPVGRAAVLAVVANGSMFVAWLLVPSLVVDQLGASPSAGGLALASAPLAMALVAPATGRWLDRSGRRRPMIAGLGVEATGLALLAAAPTEPGGGVGLAIAVIAVAMALVGAGIGMFAVANLAEVMAALPADRQGTGGGLALLLRTIGIVAGVAGSAALFDLLEPGRGFASAFRLTTAASAALALAGLTLALANRPTTTAP